MRAAALLVALAACGSPNVTLDLRFPDEATRGLTTAIVVTAVAPFGPPASGFSGRRLIKCGEMSVFPPLAQIDRDVASLAGVERTYLNREFHRFPLDETWSLDLPGLVADTAANPWQVVMLHFEARGLARAYNGRLDAEKEATLLEGCQCVRLALEASSGDAALDAEIKKSCVALSTVESGQLDLQLRPIATEPFKLEPCGVGELTAPEGQLLAGSPAVCVRPVDCNQNPGRLACFSCAQDACSELDNLSKVPVLITVEGGDARSVAKVIQTDASGRAVPEVEVGRCTGFTLKASVLGRTTTDVGFAVRCVPPARFEAMPSADSSLFAVASVTAIPGSAAGGTRAPASLAALGNASASSTVARAALAIYELVGGRMTERARLVFPNEEAGAVHGYHYQKARHPRDDDRPLLAVVTSVTRNQVEIPRVRILRWTGDRLEELAVSTGPCSVCACERPQVAGAQCTSCHCRMELEPSSRFGITDADLDGDGFADLSLAITSADPITTYFSNVHEMSPAEHRQHPRTLDGSCTCSRFGKDVSAFEMLRIGGTDMKTELANVDLVLGNVTGAFALYANGTTVDGPPCDPAAPPAAVCGPRRACVEMCPGRGRCVQRCDGTDASCDASPLSPTCSPMTMTCGGPLLRCNAPSSIWKLINVRHVKRARFTDSGFDDLIAIGSTSPAPGADDRGLIRLVFGDRVDLTRLEQQPVEVRGRAQFDITPVPFEGRSAPQGPRSAEVGDFNGDAHQDMAVLYGSSEEIHVWLGGGNRGPGEVRSGILLSATGPKCFPVSEFVVGDLDGDRLDDIAVVCGTERATVRWFKAQNPQ